MDNNARSAKAGRPSTTANVELLDGRTLVGLFGDYVRAPRRLRVEPVAVDVTPEAAA